MVHSQLCASSVFIKLKWLMLNTEKALWEDKGYLTLFHQRLLSELRDSTVGSTETGELHGGEDFFFFFLGKQMLYLILL